MIGTLVAAAEPPERRNTRWPLVSSTSLGRNVLVRVDWQAVNVRR